MLIGVADGNGVAGLSNDYGIVSHGTRFAYALGIPHYPKFRV
jgi:hypothetical protein